VVALREHYEDLTRRFFPKAWHYRSGKESSENDFYEIPWRGLAHLRMLALLEHEGLSVPDGNLHGEEVVSQPIALLRMLARGEECDVTEDFVADMLHFLHQLNGTDEVELPSRHRVHGWMDRHPSGLDRDVITWRVTNKERIVGLLAERITAESVGRPDGAYHFAPDVTEDQKRTRVQEWWLEDRFHLRYAARTADDVARYLGGAVDDETMRVMHAAEAKGIPVFATPYFLSLVDVRPAAEQEHPRSDDPIRSYLFYSEDLVEEFGSIVAWEKEDIVEPGQPNAAGWVLPSHNIHRRYPEVAIFIPDTMGRACGGLCSYCQRMYDFQRGRFNFDLDKLRPDRSWPERLVDSMEYFRNDPTLEDILITGGDSFMSSVPSLRRILWAVLEMARAKRADNASRPPGERFAEMHRVRLGTKLPVYLPQRVTEELVDLLREFRLEAHEVGIVQCVVQTHISSAMEITPYTARAVRRLLDAGWAVTNQEVFT
ncbi:MAG: KamA family protein, partial [Actinomycetes bacterium]|nr:KamA family protein [Actinomycetes bacterium]MDX5379881.1 KamA family protein [Actinomycetes bacterium]MDX5398357.1 KamA family protein [Actinomycetes bacterium]MDX5449585.1 KamA family protein [Actinomycetes bacterium]